ncbi:MAG: hypothetical protein KAI47_14970, partial [Deltaproteobacteria bacterium]|nr:hypothetical protein [Deltaproteobacteria bacterium]
MLSAAIVHPLGSMGIKDDRRIRMAAKRTQSDARTLYLRALGKKNAIHVAVGTNRTADSLNPKAISKAMGAIQLCLPKSDRNPMIDNRSTSTVAPLCIDAVASTCIVRTAKSADVAAASSGPNPSLLKKLVISRMRRASAMDRTRWNAMGEPEKSRHWRRRNAASR